jgi:hypothetical protein
MSCENCGNEHDGNIGSGRFCSVKCTRSFSTKAKRKEINEKVANKLKKVVIVKCKLCEQCFIQKRKRVFCSVSCSSKFRSNKPEFKEKISKIFKKIANERYANGDPTIGWQVRNILTPSYPEQKTIEYLNYLKLQYARELKVGRYFIDFVFNGNIALEIDGRHHEDEKIKIKDQRKDLFLKNNGWIVYRIKWKNDSNHWDRIEAFLKENNLYPAPVL